MRKTFALTLLLLFLLAPAFGQKKTPDNGIGRTNARAGDREVGGRYRCTPLGLADQAEPLF
ncbi:MAG: hypothetical protein UZ17_ACD001001917 [Acidobacteria bacterium OLB17]|nr:MAG: hypothetical protein UZ17_ACD001001917 [Acidobacteria bacterium OLB17]